MAYTQADADRLRSAIATGAKRVRFGSGENAHETEFRSLAEMKQVLADIDAALSPASRPSRVSFVAHSRD